MTKLFYSSVGKGDHLEKTVIDESQVSCIAKYHKVPALNETHSFLLICSDRRIDLELLKTELKVSSRVGFTSVSKTQALPDRVESV